MSGKGKAKAAPRAPQARVGVVAHVTMSELQGNLSATAKAKTPEGLAKASVLCATITSTGDPDDTHRLYGLNVHFFDEVVELERGAFKTAPFGGHDPSTDPNHPTTAEMVAQITEKASPSPPFAALMHGHLSKIEGLLALCNFCPVQGDGASESAACSAAAAAAAIAEGPAATASAGGGAAAAAAATTAATAAARALDANRDVHVTTRGGILLGDKYKWHLLDEKEQRTVQLKEWHEPSKTTVDFEVALEDLCFDIYHNGDSNAEANAVSFVDLILAWFVDLILAW